jgi:hypothetical protein
MVLLFADGGEGDFNNLVNRRPRMITDSIEIVSEQVRPGSDC